MAGMLEGKSALITGGGGGIGTATALAFAREGTRVAVADLVAAAAEQTVASINTIGGQAMSLTGDITSPEVVRSEEGRHHDVWNPTGAPPFPASPGSLASASCTMRSGLHLEGEFSNDAGGIPTIWPNG